MAAGSTGMSTNRNVRAEENHSDSCAIPLARTVLGAGQLDTDRAGVVTDPRHGHRGFQLSEFEDCRLLDDEDTLCAPVDAVRWCAYQRPVGGFVDDLLAVTHGRRPFFDWERSRLPR